jgi:hypothetical protein
MRTTFTLTRIALILTFFMTVSQLSFSQKPEVTVLQPDYPGIVWVKGSTQTISWVDNFIYGVDIMLIDDATASTTTITTITSGITSTYQWTIPPSLSDGNQYKIRVQSSILPGTYFDESDNYFSIVSTTGNEIVLFQPNVDGIKWLRGTSQWISWTDNLTESVSIVILDDSNNPVVNAFGGTTTATVTHPSTTYVWNIPAGFTPGYYKVKVFGSINGAMQDISEYPFEIVSTTGTEIVLFQPDVTGIKWMRGTNHLISWTDNLTYDVKINLLDNLGNEVADAFGVGTTTATITHPGSTYEWNIPGSLTPGMYKIKVYSSLDPVNIYDISEYYFEIVATLGDQIILWQPDYPGIKWLRGTTQWISWNDNLTEPVKIELLEWPSATVVPDAFGGTSFVTVTHPSSTYQWAIPGTLTATTYKIKITSTVDPANIVDISEHPFEVAASLGGEIIMIQPNVTGIKWLKGTQKWISWTDNITENVTLSLLDNLGNVVTDAFGLGLTTVTVTHPSTTYVWTIPMGLVDGDYKIKVASSFDPANIYDISENYFQIVSSLGGEIVLQQPNVSLSWAFGSQQWISWMDYITEPVQIDLLRFVGGTYTVVYTIDPSVAHPATTKIWNIPLANTYPLLQPDTRYKIRLTAVGYPAITDESDFDFELYVQVKLLAYPNPCDPYVNVEFAGITDDHYTLELYDRFGTRLLEQNVYQTDNSEVRIPTHHLPNGIYFLNATAGNHRVSQKVVVQH